MRRTLLILITGFGLLAAGAGGADAARRGEANRGAQVTRTAKAPAPARATVARATAARATAARATPARSAARATPARQTARAAAPSRRASASVATRRGEGRVVAARSAGRQTAKAARSAGRQAVAAVRVQKGSRMAQAGSSSLRRVGFVGSAAAATPRRSWHAGLPAADGDQMACPEGTMATLARGHSDTIRCMPL
ncbi:hypothetical protein LPC08_18815 [Roseomonas sp. OT10]|uniref:hypothetical protein n=1 Tax=Roseomonas cutis TaxID=2897332 RepID=UPI001E5349B2|nr:hypothetical protein [Roseomonas sp. OT10]UFN48046.1 hypothetical protein LPC08_18815 [Roseomonas sp. OT10]